MRLIRRACPDPTGRGEKDHHHWSLQGRRFHASWTSWFDYDRRNFDAPIEININTPEKHILIRPFSKSQQYDWDAGKWTDWKNSKNWRHIVSSPQKSGVWERIVERG